MRKLFFLILFLPAILYAQTTEFGFFSLTDVMDALPEYKAAQEDYNSLLERCDSEIALGEEELTRNYVAFLDGQNSFPEPILRKRQKELQDMVDRNVVLRDQLGDWLAQAHDSLFLPIIEKIDKATERVCLRNSLAFAIDTDKGGYRFIHPDFGVDITELLIEEINTPTLTEQTVSMENIEETTVSEDADTETAD